MSRDRNVLSWKEAASVMTRRERYLRDMRAWIDEELQAIRTAEVEALRGDPTLAAVCELYDITVDDVLLGVRRHDVTRVRHAAAWLLHRRGATLSELGRWFSYSNRDSVCAALRRVENDQAMRALLIGIETAA